MTNQAKFNFLELIAIFGQDNCHFVEEFETRSVETDTRNMQPNSLFVALKGEQHDSHNYIEKAIQNGAICFVVDKNWFFDNKAKFPNHNFIVSTNTIKALGKLANFHRSRFDCDIIAVAGSNGKTTTKELISAVLSTKFKTLKTYKNYNNQIGVPLMLFQLDDTIEKAVIEIGTNEPGEIYLLSEILAPTAGVITNIGKEHLQGFNDLDGVEAEETSLFAYLKKSDSVAFLNMDDERLARYLPLFDNVFTYGQTNDKSLNLNAQIRVQTDLTTKILFNDQTTDFEINLKAKGLNYAYNAIPAVAAGIFYKVPIEQIKTALENYTPIDNDGYGRMVINQLNGVLLLNDTYNANPSSTMLALKTLELTTANMKIAVLGDMLELGESSLEEHITILNKAIEVAHIVLLYGSEFGKAIDKIQQNDNIKHFSTKNEIIIELKKIVEPHTAILVKGSRGMKMEEIVEAIKE